MQTLGRLFGWQLRHDLFLNLLALYTWLEFKKNQISGLSKANDQNFVKEKKDYEEK